MSLLTRFRARGGNYLPKGAISFRNTWFSSRVNFEGFWFPNSVDFSKSYFARSARFNGATFSGNVWLIETKFSNDVEFVDSLFRGDAMFYSGIFSRNAEFRSADFFGSAMFSGAEFSRDADFIAVTFLGHADFAHVNFKGTINLAEARFVLCPPNFNGAPPLFEGTLWPDREGWPPAPLDALSARYHRSCYERLKKDAETHKKHRQEQFFFSKELECQQVIDGPWRGWPTKLYGLLSNYGSSITRPLIGLAASGRSAAWPSRT